MLETKTGQFALLRQNRFGPFFWTQFFGALNDNVFKTALLTILTFDALRWTSGNVSLLNNLIPGLFILPFVLFSALAGQLADKFDKARLSRAIKLLEIAIMGVAAIGWMLHSLWLLIAAIVGMGLHSTLFGPVKYAYLPQHLHANELIGGNGMVQMGTFVGILLGEIIGALLVVQQPLGITFIMVLTLALALLGWFASRRMPVSPAPAPEIVLSANLWRETLRNLRHSHANKPVWLALLGNSWFWFYGAIILAQFPVYAKDILHGDHGVFVLLLVMFSLGIGAGSLLCERLSGGRVDIGLVPLGALGLTLFGIDLWLASLAYMSALEGNVAVVDVAGFLANHGSVRILADCALIGVFGGFYVVPLFALIQTRCEPAHLSRTIAGMNIVNALYMVGAAGVAMLLLGFGLTIPEVFLSAALLNAGVTLAMFWRMPEFLSQFRAWLRRCFNRGEAMRD